ncbi:hypothetical protein [Hominenteromicrobium sp.]|uniref:hypothetical protein n=1 Tax=Hominenteromicrobium sp. TaxID=3073581 RepID=UPI003AEFD325
MKYRFQDNTLPFEERAKDLLSRLTREEKVGMITSQLDDIPRLGIKKTHIGTEIARGVVNRDQKRETTILPQPWGMAAMCSTMPSWSSSATWQATKRASRTIWKKDRPLWSFSDPPLIWSATRAGAETKKPMAKTRALRVK